MRDYEALVRALREHSKPEGCDCNVCPCYDAEERGYSTCSEELTEKAADAIEELQKAVYFHKYNSEFWEDKYNSLADNQISTNRKKNKSISVEERLPDEEQK